MFWRALFFIVKYSFYLVLFVGISVVSVVLYGSGAGFIFDVGDFYILLGISLVLFFVPPLILNGFFVWFRRFWSPLARYWDSLFFSILFFNLSVIVLSVIFANRFTSLVLRERGDWLFRERGAELLGLGERNILFVRGREAVAYWSYLLDPLAVGDSGAKWGKVVFFDRDLNEEELGNFGGDGDGELMNSRGDFAGRDSVRGGGEKSSGEVMAVGGKDISEGERTSRTDSGDERVERREEEGDGDPRNVGEKVKIRLIQRGNANFVPMTIFGKRYYFHLDTGASYLTLPRWFIQKHSLFRGYRPLRIKIKTANGLLSTYVGILPEVKLGPFVLDKVVFTVCDDCTDDGIGSIGLLGLSVLKRFTVTIDHSAGMLKLEPKGNSSDFFKEDLRLFLRVKSDKLKGTIVEGLGGEVQFRLESVIENNSPYYIGSVRARLTFFDSSGREVWSRVFYIGGIRPVSELRFDRVVSFSRVKFKSFRFELISGKW